MTPRPTLLVVEDDEANAKLLEIVFSRAGFSVTVAASAEAALPTLDGHTFDVILLDKNLPGMTGVELLGRIKTAEPDVEVLLMTAYADLPSILQAVSAGVYDFLIKPFESVDGVVRIVSRALDKRRLQRENKRLLAELRDSNDRLARINNDLESTVAERTRQLEQLSFTDDVTGLYNQRFLYKRLAEEVHRARRYSRALSVAMLDIDFFKRVNDNHDHVFGSRVLARIGDILRTQVRDVDIVARYGGDEFVVLLPETPAVGAAVAAERIRAKVEQTDVGEPGQPYQVTVSIGLTTLDSSSSGESEALLRAADHALYAAKADGRNCTFAARDERMERVPR